MNKTGQGHEHTECTGLDKLMNTQSTQDWTKYMHTHTVVRTGKVLEHTECTGLASHMKTASAQYWLDVTRHKVHKT